MTETQEARLAFPPSDDSSRRSLEALESDSSLRSPASTARGIGPDVTPAAGPPPISVALDTERGLGPPAPFAARERPTPQHVPETRRGLGPEEPHTARGLGPAPDTARGVGLPPEARGAKPAPSTPTTTRVAVRVLAPEGSGHRSSAPNPAPLCTPTEPRAAKTLVCEGAPGAVPPAESAAPDAGPRTALPGCSASPESPPRLPPEHVLSSAPVPVRPHPSPETGTWLDHPFTLAPVPGPAIAPTDSAHTDESPGFAPEYAPPHYPQPRSAYSAVPHVARPRTDHDRADREPTKQSHAERSHADRARAEAARSNHVPRPLLSPEWDAPPQTPATSFVRLPTPDTGFSVPPPTTQSLAPAKTKKSRSAVWAVACLLLLGVLLGAATMRLATHHSSRSASRPSRLDATLPATAARPGLPVPDASSALPSSVAPIRERAWPPQAAPSPLDASAEGQSGAIGVPTKTRLLLECSPACEKLEAVVCDDIPTAITNGTLQLWPGHHRCVFSAPGYEPKPVDIVVTDGRASVTQNVVLTPLRRARPSKANQPASCGTFFNPCK